MQLRSKKCDRDTISQMSIDSCDSREPVFVSAIDIRRRLSESHNAPKSTFQRDPEDPSASVLKEPFGIKVGCSHKKNFAVQKHFIFDFF